MAACQLFRFRLLRDEIAAPESAVWVPLAEVVAVRVGEQLAVTEKLWVRGRRQGVAAKQASSWKRNAPVS